MPSLQAVSGPEALAGGEDAWAMRVWRATQETDGTGSGCCQVSAERPPGRLAAKEQGSRGRGPLAEFLAGLT